MNMQGKKLHPVSPSPADGVMRRQFLQVLGGLGLALFVLAGLKTLPTGFAPAASEAGVLYRALRQKPEPLVSITRSTYNAEEIAAGVRGDDAAQQDACAFNDILRFDDVGDRSNFCHADKMGRKREILLMQLLFLPEPADSFRFGSFYFALQLTNDFHF